MEIDEMIVERAKAGNDEAFSKLYECIYKDMYRYAYYLLGNVQDAEDVVSDTVMDVYSGLGRLKDNKAFKSWLFRILSNKCRRKRKQYINKNISLDDENQNINLSSEHDLELKHDLESAFAILSGEEKMVVSLAVFGGYKSMEIGSIMKIKPTTARSKLSRALSKMQKKMEIQF